MRTTMIGARVPVQEAAAFRQQAERNGLSVSAALAALMRNALGAERRMFLGSTERMSMTGADVTER